MHVNGHVVPLRFGHLPDARRESWVGFLVVARLLGTEEKPVLMDGDVKVMDGDVKAVELDGKWDWADGRVAGGTRSRSRCRSTAEPGGRTQGVDLEKDGKSWVMSGII